MTQYNKGTPGNSNRQIGQYELLQTLGEGGFAKVYRGKHVILATEAAVKVLRASMVGEQAEQFEIEARTIASLQHPNIVRILDFAVENSIPFLVMEYAPHGSLRHRYPAGEHVPLAVVVSYVKQIARASQFAHDRGVIHCDVKPENILMGERGAVLLTDFGIAVDIQDLAAQANHDVVGTLQYMAPEQITGQPCAASDQYALAVVAYELLAGINPFTGSVWEIVDQHFTASPPPLCTEAPTVPHEVEQVVMKALSKDPQQRYTSISKFATALEKASKHVPSTSASSRSAAPSQHIHRRLPSLVVALLIAIFLSLSGSVWGVVTSIVHQATVTITPSAKYITHDYTLFAGTGKVGQSQHQVHTRSISSTTSPLSNTVNATGTGETPGVRASGALTFYNGMTTPQVVDAGTIFTNTNGVQVVTDVPAIIPPTNPPYLGSVTVSAHAQKVGMMGDIEAGSINQTCCSNDNSITVRNVSAFSGGQDPQPYIFVKQSDITAAADSIERALKPAAQSLLQKQVGPNEMLVSPVQCMRKVNSDHIANEKVTRVKVTVALTCTGWVFDQGEAYSITAILFKVDALKRLGQDYTLIGDVLTRFQQVSLKDAHQGTIFLLVGAKGLWVYQFSNAQKRVLAKLIVSKSVAVARTLLLKQPGVSRADIQTPWWVLWIVRDRLPESIDHISFNIAVVEHQGR